MPPSRQRAAVKPRTRTAVRRRRGALPRRASPRHTDPRRPPPPLRPHPPDRLIALAPQYRVASVMLPSVVGTGPPRYAVRKRRQWTNLGRVVCPRAPTVPHPASLPPASRRRDLRRASPTFSACPKLYQRRVSRRTDTAVIPLVLCRRRRL